MRHLRGRLSGLGVPQFVIDLPGGGGKIPLAPTYLSHSEPQTSPAAAPILFHNWRGDLHPFTDVDGPAEVARALRDLAAFHQDPPPTIRRRPHP
jgi:hypothetical protein